jgi:outer membrane lipoprotein
MEVKMGVRNFNVIKKEGLRMAYVKSSGYVLLGLFLLFLWGCAYPISKELRQEAKGSPTFAMVLQDPTAYTGSVVIWGGSIIQTLNAKEGTEILVLEAPLGYEGMPEGTRYSQGRFIAKTPKYLDPEIYKPGRRITIAGEIVGKEIRPLGKTEYAYPVAVIKEIHLWGRHRVYVYPSPYYWYGPGWWGPWPYGGWGYWDDRDEWDDWD